MKLVLLSLGLLHSVFAGPLRKDGESVPNTLENIDIIESGNFKQNIEELSGQFEGDMVLTNDQERMLNGLDRTGLIDLTYRWPDNIVPYSLSDSFTQAQRDYIELGLREIEAVSCLRFVQRTTEVDYVSVGGSGSGCSSNVGYLGRGQQSINLQYYPPGEGCFRLGTIIHEFLHTLGFYHMQSATERDEWVTILWENMQAGTEGNFNTYAADRITNFGIDYDPSSVMHYSAYGFSRNGFATIVPHDISLISIMGQRYGMTDRDITRLTSMYCPN